MANKIPPNQITAVRKRAGLTVEELAQKTGLSTTYIWRMERGERNVSLKNLQKMAEALGVAPSELIESKPVADVPILSWVSAGMMARDDVQQDVIGEIRMSDLDPRGDWVALRVDGDSMDRISPPGSLILVDLTDKALVPNACYIITDSDNQATYKRFRSNPPRFEPVSTNPSHEPIFPDGDPAVVGRVRRSLIDM
jgi:transcriptional regulator with XRE-family HTH domain